MAKRGNYLGLLRRFQDNKDVGEYLKTEYRQNLKELESWRKDIDILQSQGQLADSIVFCYYNSLGTGGAVLDTAKSPDIKLITRQSAGNYLIQLNKVFSDVSFLDFYLKLGSGVPGVSFIFLRSIDTVSREIVVEFTTGAGTPADPLTGSFVGIRIYLTEE
jgi:hypothetical protein